MATEIKVHPAQAKILLKLLFTKEATFTKLLKGTGLTSDHFSFHINKLTELTLVKKSINQYQLTPKGKEFVNRFDTQKKVLERQAKIGVLVVCIRKNGETTEYLMQRRLKQPYYGFYGFVSGKISWGETAFETAARELKEETGLTANLMFAGVEHKTDYSQDNEILEDKFFFIFKGTDPVGKLIRKFKGGKNIWMTYEQILNLDTLFKDVRKIISIVNQTKVVFEENKFIEKIY